MSAYSYPHTRARRAPAKRPLARVRWDRLARVVMLCVLCALLYLYISAGVSLLASWRESGRTKASVAVMEREYRALQAHRVALESPAWLEMQARQLGMMFPGERQYLVRGLPGN